VAITTSRHGSRLSAVRREEERVTPLELFSDLVFVLAITQCTSLMAAQPDWLGLARGLAVLALLWWAWTGYAWLTSVVDPEEGSVRAAMFGAMAAFLVVALCVPRTFGELGLTFAIAYGGVRVAHIALFVLASRDEPALRRSVWGLAVSTAIGVGLLAGASFAGGSATAALWSLALLIDIGGPFLFGAAGWQLVPGHFAERHGLIVIIALGESIVAIGLGAQERVTAGVVTGAVIGIALAAAMWWAYFDVVSLVAARRLAQVPAGREQNELARDAYSYLHFPMVAGIVLIALGVKTTLGHVGDRLHTEAAVALVGGLAMYLLAHVGFRLRMMRSVNRGRLGLGILLLALVPLARVVPALAALAGVTVLAWALILYETIRYADVRDRVRHDPA
jgi:low temperature requirement protein LtrA